MEAKPNVTISQLVELFPGIELDIQNVSQWFGCDIDRLSFSLDTESIANRATLAVDLLSTYPKFPRDERRMRRVQRGLKRGAKAWPIFVDAVDDFLMEGRHRIVAFYLEGLQTINVVRVKPN